MAEGVLRNLRSGKGRLKVGEGVETFDIKVRIESKVAEELKQAAKKLNVPMAKIIREGLEKRLRELENNI